MVNPVPWEFLGICWTWWTQFLVSVTLEFLRTCWMWWTQGSSFCFFQVPWKFPGICWTWWTQFLPSSLGFPQHGELTFLLLSFPVPRTLLVVLYFLRALLLYFQIYCLPLENQTTNQRQCCYKISIGFAYIFGFCRLFLPQNCNSCTYIYII